MPRPTRAMRPPTPTSPAPVSIGAGLTCGKLLRFWVSAMAPSWCWWMILTVSRQESPGIIPQGLLPPRDVLASVVGTLGQPRPGSPVRGDDGARTGSYDRVNYQNQGWLSCRMSDQQIGRASRRERV